MRILLSSLLALTACSTTPEVPLRLSPEPAAPLAPPASGVLDLLDETAPPPPSPDPGSGAAPAAHTAQAGAHHGAGPFLRAPQDDAPPDGGWAFVFSPYLWAASVSGHQTVHGATAEVDASFGDLVDHLDLALLGTFEARSPDDGLFVIWDNVYLDLEADDAAVGPAQADITLTTWISELDLGAPLVAEEHHHLDLLAGARYWSMETDFDVQGGPSVDGSVDWVDPVVGLRYRHAFDRDLSFAVRGDVGGFGVGGASDRTWQAVGLAEYELGEATTLGIGYRHLVVHYDRSGGQFAIDQRFSGPLVGMRFRF